MKERRILQFALGSDHTTASTHGGRNGALLYALDEEGALWFLPLARADGEEMTSAHWVALPALPERRTEADPFEKPLPAPEASRSEEAATSPAPAEDFVESQEPTHPAFNVPHAMPDSPQAMPDSGEVERASEPAIAVEARGPAEPGPAEEERDELPWMSPPVSPRPLVEEDVRPGAPPLPTPGLTGGLHPAERDDL
jgi:hypothetical protein